MPDDHEPSAVPVTGRNLRVPRRFIATGVACTAVGSVLVTPLSMLLTLILVAQGVLPYNVDHEIYPWAVAVGTALCMLGIACALVIRRFDPKSAWVMLLLGFNFVALAFSALVLYTWLTFDGGSV